MVAIEPAAGTLEQAEKHGAYGARAKDDERWVYIPFAQHEKRYGKNAYGDGGEG